jgi:streptogramin lyase
MVSQKSPSIDIKKFLPRALLIFICIGLMALLVLAIFVFRELTAADAGLTAQGSAYELNPDETGRLWISDFNTHEVWGVNPKDGTYQIFTLSGSPVDARQSDGWLWWADGRSNVLSQISISDGTFTQWQVPDAYGFLGTNLDAQGRLYATDSSNPSLYRLDPSKSSLCVFSLPGFGASNYIIRNGDYLWLGDSYDSILIRLNTVEEQLTWWSLAGNSSPFGLAVDESGNVWFADQGIHSISQLDPTSNQLNSYILPEGNYPQMLAIQSGVIWFTEQSLPGIGRLDPHMADHAVSTLTFATYQSDPHCNQISPSGSGTVPITKGKIILQKISSTPDVNAFGWQYYQLPESSNPWGIGLTDAGYVVDAGRQILLRFEFNQEPTPVSAVSGKIIPSNIPVEAPRLIPTPLWSKNLSIYSLREYLPVITKDADVGLP